MKIQFFILHGPWRMCSGTSQQRLNKFSETVLFNLRNHGDCLYTVC